MMAAAPGLAPDVRAGQHSRPLGRGRGRGFFVRATLITLVIVAVLLLMGLIVISIWPCLVIPCRT